MNKSIIFDWNGTLINDTKLTFQTELNSFKKNGIKVKSINYYRGIFVHPISKYYDLVGLNPKDYDYEKLNNEFFEEYKKQWRNVHLFKNAKEVLIDLKCAGYDLYIISATEINLLKEQLEFFGIIDLFKDIIASDNTSAVGKTEYGKIFAKEHNLTKENCVLVGDTTHDYELSEALDIPIIFFSKGHNTKKRLKTLNLPIADNYKQLKKMILNKKY